jgi:hypothetical protein
MKLLSPVTLPPGRLSVWTRPTSTGSSPMTNTIGIVVVAAFAASAAGSVDVTITATRRPMRSAASPGSRSNWPRAHLASIAALLPSTRPASCKPSRNPAKAGVTDSGEPPLRNPTSGMRCCARSERPCDHRSAEQRDEVAALHLPAHSITSSARASSVAGMSMPSSLAVFRLITSSYLVGAWTGKSAGFSPLRMRST